MVKSCVAARRVTEPAPDSVPRQSQGHAVGFGQLVDLGHLRCALCAIPSQYSVPRLRGSTGKRAATRTPMLDLRDARERARKRTSAVSLFASPMLGMSALLKLF
jgi:hypothetical protein